ncbi:hypothetical protein KRIGEM_00858 [Komagataeibacter rhaeticus]|nr:hypothetical protein KRIGEM_00858 [Komagataeibacter rhaeticus]
MGTAFVADLDDCGHFVTLINEIGRSMGLFPAQIC